MRRNIILCDIDHTLSNAFWRDEMIGGPGGWDAYHAASKNDDPLDDIVDMINVLVSSGYKVIGITARPAKWRQLTMQWLVDHGVMIDQLLMRPDDAFHPAPEIKIKLAKEHLGDGFCNDVAFIIDDRDDIAVAFKGCGVTVFQVHARQS